MSMNGGIKPLQKVFLKSLTGKGRKSKSSPEFAEALLEEAKERLQWTGYEVMLTPFGYFNEFKMHVAGDSLAKVFKEF